MKRNRNIYMGPSSTAQMPVFGKVDTDNEICLNAIATAYDALDSRMVTRTPGVFDKTTLVEINGRFSVLRLLCRKYAPDKLATVDRIHNVVVEHFKGHISTNKALGMLQEICIKNNLNPGILNIAMFHINRVEQSSIPMPDPFGLNMFDLFNQTNNMKKKRGRF